MVDSEQTGSSGRRKLEPDFEIRFPPLPRTVALVTALMAENADPPDTPRLVEIIRADPVVGTSVLRRINSAYYGMRTRIVDIDKACQFLGFDEVCDIVLTAGMMKLGDIFETPGQIAIFDRIMELSLGSAVYNKKLAEDLDVRQKGLAFTTGLLHTVGRLVILYNRPGEYESLWYETETGRPPTVTSEQIIFGTDHTELATLAGKEWNLPEEAVTVVRSYLTPGHVKNQTLRVLALCLSIASAAADHYCLDGGESAGRAFSPPAALFGLASQAGVKPDRLTTLIEREREEVLRFIRSMVDPQND